MVLSELDFTATEKFFVLFQVRLDASKFFDQLVVLEDFQVFNVIVSLIISFELLLWLSWVDSFEDAELSEILERQLHFPDGITASKVLGCFSLHVLLYLLHFYN